MKKLVVANWKMNPKSLTEAVRECGAIARSARALKKVETVIAPPTPFLGFLLKTKGVTFGAQDISTERGIGAATGEVSGAILKQFGVRYVIVGHSERRTRGEAGPVIAAKVTAALREGLTPILCVGEQERDEDGAYFQELRTQIHESLDGVPKAQLKNVIVAYEPVWAVGVEAERADTPEETLETVLYIRKIISEISHGRVQNTPVLYGGSVLPANASAFLKHGGVAGLLVGRASLKPRLFAKILKSAQHIA